MLNILSIILSIYRNTYSEASTTFVSTKCTRRTLSMNFPLQYSGGIVFAEMTASFSKCLTYSRSFFSSEVFNGTGAKNISESSASIVLAGRSPIRHSLLNISPLNSSRIKIGASTVKFPGTFGRNVSRNLHRSPFRNAH